jgi:hypothetical protein
MAIPGPGTAISINTIVAEFGGTAPHSISEYYRGGGLVPNTPGNAAIPTSGTIALGNFYGSANRVVYTITISGNTQNYDTYTNRSPTYVPGISDITYQINPGVTVGSTSTPAYALLVPSAFSPTDTVTIVNNGAIRGAGGNGGPGGNANTPVAGDGAPGASGGRAIYVNRPTTITNNNTVAGGGGGGGGGAGNRVTVTPVKGPATLARSGSGGGGGAGATTVGTGGTAGVAVGFPSAPGNASQGLPGSPGGVTTGGAGGVGPANTAPGGAGGGAGAAGGTSPQPRGGAAGAAGNYITGNAFVTWPVTGTRQGGVA